MDHPPLRRAIIATDLPCIHCAYNLRTVDLDSPCPECGRPARESLDGLSLADTDDLARVALGIRLMLLSALGGPVVFAGLIALQIFALPDGDAGKILGGVTIGLVGPVVSFVGACAFGSRIRRFEGSFSPPGQPPWTNAQGPAILAGAQALAAVAGLVLLLASNFSHVVLPGIDLIPVGFFGAATVLWGWKISMVCRRGARLAHFAAAHTTVRTLNWGVRLAVIGTLTGTIIGGAAFAIDVLGRVFHIGIFDSRFDNVSLDWVALPAVAILYVAFFGGVVINPIALYLMHRCVANSLRLARTRARGPVVQAVEPPAP